MHLSFCREKQQRCGKRLEMTGGGVGMTRNRVVSHQHLSKRVSQLIVEPVFEMLKVNLSRPFILSFTEPILWFWNAYIAVSFPNFPRQWI